MEIEEKEMKGYEVICPYCKKVLTSLSWSQLNYNYNIHKQNCKLKKEEQNDR